MKLVSAYANVTLESSLTKEQVRKAKMHCPEAFVLKDEKEVNIFAISFNGRGAITGGGVSFDNMTGSGNPFVTVVDNAMPADLEKRGDYLRDTYGRIVFLAKKTEDQVIAALANLTTEIQTVADAIVVG